MMKITLILLLAGVLLQLLLHRLAYKERDEICSRSFMRILFFFSLVLLGLAIFNQIFSIPHRLLGETLLTPGSLLTRSITIPSSYFLRRILDPCALLFLLCFGIYGHTFIKESSRNFLATGLSLWVLTLSYEGHVLFSQSGNDLNWLPVPAGSVLWVLSLICINISFFIEIFTRTPFRLAYKKKLLSLHLMAPWCIILSGILYSLNHSINHTPVIKNIMAHYYVWFPENWKAGYAGRDNHENYPRPFPEEYNSDNPSTILQHINQMKYAGITHAIIDWWPRKPLLKNRAVTVARTLDSQGDIKFALHLETLEIAKNGSRDIIEMGERETAILKAFFEHLVKRMKDFKNYHRIDGKMVVYLYASRHLIGNIPATFQEIRNYIKEKFDEELYLVGDEIFYNVPDAKTGTLLPPFIPSWERIRAFDALTFYNPYNPHTTYDDQDKGILKLTRETEELLYKYRGIAETGGIPIIPAIIPGYDDRVLRPENSSTPISRKTSRKRMLLDLLYTSTIKTLGTSMGNSLIITSWNEWNEGTQIEPGTLSSRSEPDMSKLELLKSWKATPTSR